MIKISKKGTYLNGPYGPYIKYNGPYSGPYGPYSALAVHGNYSALALHCIVCALVTAAHLHCTRTGRNVILTWHILGPGSA